jgi:hypothetical protein
MIKEAIDKILDLAHPFGISDPLGRFFVNAQAKQILPPMPVTIPIHSLTGLVDLLKAGTSVGIDEPVFIHIIDHESVNIVACNMDSELRRRVYAKASFRQPGFPYDTFMPVEKFIVSVRAHFIQNEAVNYIFQIAGNISSDSKVRSIDDGISQSITIKKGIAKVESVVVQDILTLIPFRTFPEVDQPSSEFIFRMRVAEEGGTPSAAIFTAGSERWKLDAIKNIKSWFYFNTDAFDKNKVPILFIG